MRLSLRRLQDAALASRDVDADQFVLWGAALLATPLLFNTVTWTSRYPWLRHRSLEALHDAVLADRLFFVTWPMLVMWLVGALTVGRAVARQDRPAGARRAAGVEPRGGRGAAGGGVAGGAHRARRHRRAAGAGLRAGRRRAPAASGRGSGIAAGQATASLSAGLFAFSSLLAVRGLLVCVVGAAAAAKAAVALQAVAVVLLVETFLFLPGLMPAAVRTIASGDEAGMGAAGLVPGSVRDVRRTESGAADAVRPAGDRRAGGVGRRRRGRLPDSRRLERPPGDRGG